MIYYYLYMIIIIYLSSICQQLQIKVISRETSAVILQFLYYSFKKKIWCVYRTCVRVFILNNIKMRVLTPRKVIHIH